MGELTTMVILIRIITIVVCAGLIGLEREHIHKPAGLRTNILVGLGTTLMMIIAIKLSSFSDPSAVSRIASQAITGVGFLGAGAIFQGRNSVFGLTTAATIWVVAAIGLAVGIGYYTAAIIATSVALITLYFLGRAEHHSPPPIQ